MIIAFLYLAGASHWSIFVRASVLPYDFITIMLCAMDVTFSFIKNSSSMRGWCVDSIAKHTDKVTWLFCYCMCMEKSQFTGHILLAAYCLHYWINDLMVLRIRRRTKKIQQWWWHLKFFSSGASQKRWHLCSRTCPQLAMVNVNLDTVGAWRSCSVFFWMQWWLCSFLLGWSQIIELS